MASYNRKRKAELFLKSQMEFKKFKSHSPNFTNVTWDKDGVPKDLHAAIASDQN